MLTVGSDGGGGSTVVSAKGGEDRGAVHAADRVCGSGGDGSGSSALVISFRGLFRPAGGKEKGTGAKR